MDAKEQRKKNKKEKREAKKEEMQYFRKQLQQLVNDEKREQLAFPPTLQSGQRKQLHTYAHTLGLKSKSTGKGENRFLVVYKKNVAPCLPTADSNATYLRLTNNTVDKLVELFANDPVSDVEKESTVFRSNEGQSHAHLPFMFGDTRSKARVTIPPKTMANNEFTAARHSLPIFEYRDEILGAINQHQVVVISGETGSGKTTQVPQYIMEDYSVRQQECRIICTQPRRLAATSIATRISQERNDTLGRSVGYQIRLDSRISATTNLIFTTSGFLLRCLTGSKSEDVYKNLTHLILDEVHEREKVTDFLLIAIRDVLKANPHLKVILMSATLDSEQFSKYFDNCPVINVPGRMFDVEIMHLGDVLMATDYKTKEMTTYMNENQAPKILRANKTAPNAASAIANGDDEKVEVSADDIQFYDECFDECMEQEEDAPFEQIFCLITDENMPVDYVHSTKGRTALGIAAEKGFYDVVTRLLSFGANPSLKDSHGKIALDYADENEQEDCCELLAHYQNFTPIKETILENDDDSEAQAKAWQQFKLVAYKMTSGALMKSNDIDHELLQHCLQHIHTEKPLDGSILVFLPGYDDIMVQKEMIETRFRAANYQLFVLHSGVNGTSNAEQTRVFERMPAGIRKIILSTNIAETSLTINDVVYVVDAGKVKQLSYDSIGESTCLTSTDISQACAKQRAGRAGRIRNGYCYRLYSLEQYEAMEKYTLPEILRVPLTEICLNAKMLAGNLSIEEFLVKALQPPSVKNIRQSIELLKKINALDDKENITYLGIHLANMPVDCQLGKMILYAIMMRCLDPVVTIVSALSVKDPFMLPLGNEGEKITEIKKGFAQNSMSDHQMLLNAFNEWSGQKKKQYEFCHDNFISYGNMQMIQGVRRLIMGHLKMAEFVCENTARNIRKLNENSLRWEIVKACLTAGMYPNVCRLNAMAAKIYSKQDNKLSPHMSSVLRERRARGQIDRGCVDADAKWMIHGEKSRITHLCLIRNVTVIPAIDVALFAGPISLPESSLKSSRENKVEVHSDMDCDDIPDEDEMGNVDLDDDELYAHGDEYSSDAVLSIDDWISFIIDETEASLVFQLRQKFNSMFVKFLRNPVSFQMTNKEAAMLKTLLEVICEEDDIEQFVKAKTAAIAAKEKENESDGVVEAPKRNPEQPRQINRKPIPERPAETPIKSDIYSEAIEPEHRRNRKKKKNNKLASPKKKLDWRRNDPEPADWRRNDPGPAINWIRNVPDHRTPPVIQGSNSTDSSSNAQLPSSQWNPQQRLTQGLFNQLNAPFAAPTLSHTNAPSASTARAPAPNLPFNNDPFQNRYFVLTVRDVGQIYASVYQHHWKFRTPLHLLKKAARESAPAKIILLLHVQKKSAIFGICHFQNRSSGNYHIVNIADKSQHFRPLIEFDATDDYEMAPEEGNDLYNQCINMAK